MADTAPTDLKTADEERRQQQCAQKWIAELGVSEKSQHRWLERAKKIVRRYKDETRIEDGKRRFAMLWSNTETIKPAVYARAPQPVVTRRFDDADPVARMASEALERSLSTSIELQDLDAVYKLSRDDFILIGRGQTWERYVPTEGPQVIPEIELQIVGDGDGNDGPPEYADIEGKPYEGEVQLREDGTAYGQGEPYNPIVYEESITDYVNWEDFGHSVARTWNEVWYVWRRVYLSREQLIERFGENLGRLVPLDWGPIQQGQRDVENHLLKKAAIYEIWDKNKKKVYWVSKSWSSRPLDERDDPLGLEGFFPCPRPLLATTANDSVIPVPDYVYYQDQAEEIDKLTARIAELQDALKVRGFYAADQKTNLNTLLNSSNNQLIPVPDWLNLKEGGGARGMIEWWPIEQVVKALDAIIAQRQQLISDVYQITGVSDILRGMNDPSATATAERIKGAWGTLRIRTKQVELMRFARDGLRIKAEVIAEKFDIETLRAISGLKIPTAAEKVQLQQQLIQQAQQAAMQAQMAAMQAQQQPQAPGQPPGPAMGHNGGPPMPSPEPTPEQQKILTSPTWEDVIGLLRDNAGRQFRIEVETDSTIEPDEGEQKAMATEFIGAIGSLINQAGPAVTAQPLLAPMFGELIKWGARRFRAGRELETIIDQTMDKITQAAAQPQPGAQAPPVDKTPVEVAQIDQRTEEIKQHGENQRAAMAMQVDQGQQTIDANDQRLKLTLVPRDPEPQISA